MRVARKVLPILMSAILVVSLCPGLAFANPEGETGQEDSQPISEVFDAANEESAEDALSVDEAVDDADSPLVAQSYSAPSRSNKFFYSKTYNPYYSANLVGQCTWYAQGRASEILGKQYVQTTYRGNAKTWWDHVKGYDRGQIPRANSIACSTGQYGHVAIVEAVGANGSITVSEYYGGSGTFHTGTYANGAAWARVSKCTFQGYIYLTGAPTPTAKAPTIRPYDVLGGEKIQIINNQSGATVRYTIDGKTNPTASVGNIYNGSWLNNAWPVMGVRAAASKSGMNTSGIAYYTSNTGLTSAPRVEQTNTPTGATIELKSDTKNATIFYTTNGTNPTFDILSGTSNAKKYTGAIALSQNCNIRAIAVASGMRVSSVTSQNITCVAPNTPEPTVSADKIAQGDAVTVSWNRDASAASYTATLYKGGTAVDTQTTITPQATFVLSDAAEYSISVKAANSIGESAESTKVRVQAIAPLTVRFMSNYTDENGTAVSRVDNEQKVKYGSDANIPQPPKRRGYDFAGWEGATKQIKEDVDIVAKWNIKEYTIQFYAADGQTSLSRQTVEFGKAAEAPNPGNAPTGKVFSGWAVTDADNDSNRDFAKVDSDMKLRAVFSWADEELPVVAEITNAERTASGNYTVDVKLTNHPTDITTALLRVALKTTDGKLVQTSRETVEIGTDSEIEKSVTLKYNGNYVASIAEAEVVGLDGNYRTGGAYSAAVQKEIVTMDNFYFTDWSEWSTEKPTASDTVEVEEAVQYRYRDRQFTTSTASSLAGWDRNNKDTTTYGAWSGYKYTTSKPGTNDTLQIVGQSTKYTYYRWCNWYDGCQNQDSKAYGSGCTYHEVTLSSPMAACPNKFADKGGKAWDLHGPYGSCAHRRAGQSYWWTKSIVTTYTYQTRDKTITYGYQKWGDWTDWTFDEAAATSDREVENRTVYRYRTKQAGQIQGEEDKSGTKQSISGKLAVGADLSGKEATIMVYNVTNSDPNEDQIQFIGQTKIGADNTYSFDFIPRQDPSVESGDFVVALGVKGSTGLVNVATIKAPTPQYKVIYQYEDSDGSTVTINEQLVNEGEDAIVPAAPQREGCTFLGWSRTSSGVNNNLVINALFSQRTCTVAWVDHEGEEVFLQTCSYGQELKSPMEQPDRGDEFGYIFKGWDAIIDGATTVTGDMVVTAVYEPKVHTVMFVDAKGAAFKTVQVEHGKAAQLPDTNPTMSGMEFVSWGTTSETPWWSVTRDLVVKPLFAYEGTVTSPYASVEVAEGYVARGGTKVFLETPTDGAKIYYTTDGTDPVAPAAAPVSLLAPLEAFASFLMPQADDDDEEIIEDTTAEYDPNAGITITQPTKIRAIACASDMNDSSISEIEVNATATNNIANAEAGISEAPFYYGKPVEPGIMVWLGDDLLVYGDDYTIEYSNNNAIGKAKALVKGKGAYTGQKEVEFDIVAPPAEEGEPIDIANTTIDAIAQQTYTGSAITPEPVVKYGSQTLTKGTDYAVSYENNVNEGTATCWVEGKGKYAGKKSVMFQIKKAATSDPGTTDPKPVDPAPSDPGTQPSNPDTPTDPAPKPDDPGATEPKPVATETMYRLYNPNSGEHFYTSSPVERQAVIDAGWNDEGVGWTAPTEGIKVYRLYNSYAGEHHYTTSEAERDMLVGVGWTWEEGGWYSDPDEAVPLYRAYNPNAYANNHHYTLDWGEFQTLLGLGWQDEGVGWHGVN